MRITGTLFFALFCCGALSADEGEWTPAWQPVIYSDYCGVERHYNLSSLNGASAENAKVSPFETTSVAFHVFIGHDRLPTAFDAIGVEADEVMFTVQLFKHPAREIAYNVSVAGHEALLIPGDLQGMYAITGPAAESVLNRLVLGERTSLSVNDDSDPAASLVIDSALFDVSSDMFSACVESQTRNKQRQQGRASSAHLL